MIDKEEKIRNKEFADFLQDEFLKWQMQQKRASGRTLTKWAHFLDISPQSLSHYMNQTRKPTGEVVYQLAASLGPKVLDILKLPPALPNSPEVIELVTLWMSPYTTDKQREQALELLKINQPELEGLSHGNGSGQH